ncbi:MAG: M64 family metallopeptidase [Defluviitaleaceae bacterium]|nr:M64 family metallopeptidase [Defluviitaleaceae bacterium]
MRKFHKIATSCIIFCMMLSLLPSVALALPHEEELRDNYTLSEIRQMLQQDNAHGYKRVHCPDGGGCTTYQLTQEEAIEMFGSPIPAGIQAFNDFDYTVRNVFGEGRDCHESIVLVLLGDGFTAGNEHGDVGYWPNPAYGTFLYSARRFAHILTNSYPFSLFSDYFKVYAVETPSTQQGIRTGTALDPVTYPYPGSYFGSFIRIPFSPGSIRVQRSAHALDISNWVSPNSIMTQMILNAERGGGLPFLLLLPVTRIVIL